MVKGRRGLGGSTVSGFWCWLASLADLAPVCRLLPLSSVHGGSQKGREPCALSRNISLHPNTPTP